MKRRTFIAAATAAPIILPRTVFGANNKLNIAFIGMGGQIQGHVKNALQLGHNVVAFCDVDPNQIAGSRNRHKAKAGNVKSYADYRELLEKEKTLDAVVVATPDHWHALICTAAMKAGRHVYCEKPLTHTIAESRALRELSRSSKVVTQTGNHKMSLEMTMVLLWRCRCRRCRSIVLNPLLLRARERNSAERQDFRPER